MFLPLFLAALALAGDEGCAKCEHRGVVACTKHDVSAEDEERVAFCSFAADCPLCGGTLWMDCARCDGGKDTQANAARREEIVAWRAPDSLEEHMQRAVQKLDTERFELVIDVGVLRDGSKKVGPHPLAHRIAEDVEHVAAKIAEHYALKPADYRAKMRMWLWSTLEDHQLAQSKFLGSVTTGDFKTLGRDPVFSVWTEPENFDDVTKVRTLFAHNAAHMLLSNAIQSTWVGDQGGGWLDAGIGHWYEYERFGRTAHYCIEEATLVQNWENGVWRAPIRRRLEKEEAPFLPGLLAKNAPAMSQPEHALCWSFHDYLVARHREKLRPILTELKQEKRDARAILAEHLGMDLLATEAAWHAWVRETYPLKGDEPRPSAPK